MMPMENGNPVDDVKKAAEKWAEEIFMPNFSEQLKKKKHPISAILRKSSKRSSLIFPPFKFDGLGCLCTVHYVDVVVDGLPDKRNEEFQTKLPYVDGFTQIALGFNRLWGTLVWNWQKTEKVKDVIMSYDNDIDKIRMIRAKLGTRVVTCKQAVDLVLKIQFDPEEYVPNYLEPVRVIDYVIGDSSTHYRYGKVKAYDRQKDTYKIIWEGPPRKGSFTDKSGGLEVEGRLVMEARSKQHLREDVVVTCFSRVLDLENFIEVVQVLPVEGQLNVANRLGWLNIMSGMKPYYTFDLDPSSHEHWVMLNVVYKLSKVEKGENGDCPHTGCGRDGKNIAWKDERKMKPCSAFRCDDKKCSNHWFPSHQKFVEGDKFHGFSLETNWGWNDKQFEPHLGKYRSEFMKEENQNFAKLKKGEKGGVEREGGGRYQTRYCDDESAPDVREDLRAELNARYFLCGVARIEGDSKQGSNKMLRVHSYGHQGYK